MLKTLASHGVEFLVVGGIAGALHGSSSITFDLDICHSRTFENLDCLEASLKQLGARLRGAPEDIVPWDARTLLAEEIFTFATTWGDLDCMGAPAGTKGFNDLNANAVEMDIEGMKIRVVSLNDLIRIKRASGRPKDRVELEVLGALREELEKG